MHVPQVYHNHRFTHTPFVPIYVAYCFWSKSNVVKFDQVFSKIYQLLQFKINIIRIIINYTFLLCIVGIANINIFCYIHG
jgi:hypothetical protein